MAEHSKTVRLEDYEPYPWKMGETRLSISLHDDHALVESELAFNRKDTNGDGGNIRLEGQELELLKVSVDGRDLNNNEYAVDDDSLTIFDAPDNCVVSVQNRIHPESNTKLLGLYRTGGLYCTQCEAESFRKITYYPDRPDVAAEFFTTIEAERSEFPMLLSNGNLIHEESVGETRHKCTWHDPFPKPSYLFALVAGDLATIEDSFVTRSGRHVQLNIYSEEHNIEKCRWAMDCLKRAMSWDERTYGREYDLDRFMIVAVENFNFGAMENKGLNIFNVAVLLADPDVATDADYWRVEGVVAHEYFHNWSGNRVTCRDWFQLSLKEGFTVYRDTKFSEDIHGSVPIRINTVSRLRDIQFIEDGGALAHPVRPSFYDSIENFYTPTIYEKGAEVVRMLNSMVGDEVWRRATDRYFHTFDHQAVTIEDFVHCVELEGDVDLSQFFRWYDQAGTPNVTVKAERLEGELKLDLNQTCRPTAESAEKQPFHIPIAMGVVDEVGREVIGKTGEEGGYQTKISSKSQISNPNDDGTVIINLTDASDRIHISGVPDNAAISINRGFSAPIEVHYDQPLATRIQLALNDTDGFNRWNASQSVFIEGILEGEGEQPRLLEFEGALIDGLLNEPEERNRSIMLASLKVPTATYVLDSHPNSDFDQLLDNRQTLQEAMAREHFASWTKLLEANGPKKGYELSDEEVCRRSIWGLALKHVCLATKTSDQPILAADLVEKFRAADNLTDRISIVAQLIELSADVDELKQSILDEFFESYKDESLVVNHWLRVQATCPLPGAVERIRALGESSAFSLQNANHVRSLINAFAYVNEVNFHAEDGSGYRFIAEKVIELDPINPTSAATLAKTLTNWLKFGNLRQRLMRGALQQIQAEAKSDQVIDVVKRGLA